MLIYTVLNGILHKLVERLYLLVDHAILHEEMVNNLPLIVDINLFTASAVLYKCMTAHGIRIYHGSVPTTSFRLGITAVAVASAAISRKDTTTI